MDFDCRPNYEFRQWITFVDHRNLPHKKDDRDEPQRHREHREKAIQMNVRGKKVTENDRDKNSFSVISVSLWFKPFFYFLIWKHPTMDHVFAALF